MELIFWWLHISQWNKKEGSSERIGKEGMEIEVWSSRLGPGSANFSWERPVIFIFAGHRVCAAGYSPLPLCAVKAAGGGMLIREHGSDLLAVLRLGQWSAWDNLMIARQYYSHLRFVSMDLKWDFKKCVCFSPAIFRILCCFQLKRLVAHSFHHRKKWWHPEKP